MSSIKDYESIHRQLENLKESVTSEYLNQVVYYNDKKYLVKTIDFVELAICLWELDRNNYEVKRGYCWIGFNQFDLYVEFIQ